MATNQVDELSSLRTKSQKLQDEVINKIQELNKLRLALETVTQERDQLQEECKKLQEKQVVKIDKPIIDVKKSVANMKMEEIPKPIIEEPKINVKEEVKISVVETEQEPEKAQQEDSFDEEVEDAEESINRTIISNTIQDKEDGLPQTDEELKELSYIVDQTENILRDVAATLQSSGKTFRRALGSDNIYTLKLRNPDGLGFTEMEVIMIDYFVEKINDLSSIRLQEDEEEFLTRVFAVKKYPQLIQLDQILSIMRNLGVREDIPRSKKHLNYEKLSLKSKRIINRICSYLKKKGMDADEFFAKIVLNSNVKTKTKTDKVDIMKDTEFFKMLADAYILRRDQLNMNLCAFLCIDETYVHTLMYKKLKRAI